LDDQIEKEEMGELAAHVWEMRYAYGIVLGNSEGNRLFRKT
jgi:hypothetical protein